MVLVSGYAIDVIRLWHPRPIGRTAFAAQSAKEKLESKGLAEAADLLKVTKILDTVIDQTIKAVEEPSAEPPGEDPAI